MLSFAQHIASYRIDADSYICQMNEAISYERDRYVVLLFFFLKRMQMATEADTHEIIQHCAWLQFEHKSSFLFITI